ncbi:hypothetical protein LIER_36376 [Lithospermum erythrorhizon]|uniref:Reverse transcriptase domain-containing protein n=1 Tax=Lithospermum erythrorhizon TaxID=34254 RepID=A0AAV3P522_LITER
MWTKHPDFLDICATHWGKIVHGSAQYKLCIKLKALKKPLQALNWKEFGGISQKASSAKEEFQEAFGCLVGDPDNVALREKVDKLRKASKSLSESELSFLKQKAKCQHLLEADKGTKYYHALINKNRARSHISYIVKDDGLKTTSYMEMADLFVGFYKGLFGTRRQSKPIDLGILEQGPCVPSDEAEGLLAPILGDEIKATLWEMDGDKAPGPDGFSATFFKANWDLVGQDLTLCVQEFFNTGKLLKQLNHTIVALIPKTSHDPKVGDFRPIGCTNVIYKVITKILTKRMAKFLPIIVDPGQTAFVKGRNISDNVFLAQEIVRGYKVKRNSPRCMIMLDIRKAYDTVSWDFVESFLLGLGFLTKFVGWIMECVTTASYSISINGQLHGHFKGECGLRQGGPMHGDSYLIKEIVKIRNELEVAFGGQDRAIDGLSRFVVGNKFLSGKVYDVLRVARVKKPWMSCVWKHFIPPKHSFTVWLACRGLLRSPLATFSLVALSRPWFGDEIRRWLGVARDMSTLASAIKWIIKEFKGCRVKDRAVRIAFSSTIFEVWAARNVINFDGGKVSTQDIITRVKTTTYRILYRLNPHCRFTF